MSVNGLVVMTPTSIASTGTGNSSSIGANGKVTFSSCTSLSLNGVFTSSYDNYMVNVRYRYVDGVDYLAYRLRVGGSDATGTNYTYQRLDVDNTTVVGARQTLTIGLLGYGSTEQRSGLSIFMFGPNLAQPTAARSVSVSGYAGGYIYDVATTHSVSTAYDGFTLLDYAGLSRTKTGEVTVYGFNQ